MQNTKIIVACHCSKEIDGIHQQLYMYTQDGYTRQTVEDYFGSENVWYVDTDSRCNDFPRQYTTWADIPSQEFDIVYLSTCPMYHDLHTWKNFQNDRDYESMKRTIWNDILEEGFRILKPSGVLLVPIESTDIRYNPLKNMPVRNSTNTNNTYKKKLGFYFRRGLKKILHHLRDARWDIYLMNPTMPNALPLLYSKRGTKFHQYLLLGKRTKNQRGGGTRKKRI